MHTPSDRNLKRTFRPARRRRGGFTLLEVLLAIALSTVLLFTLGEALYVFVRMTDSSRTKIEEMKLARHVLALISKDIENVVVAQQQDMTGRIMPGDEQQAQPPDQEPPPEEQQPEDALLDAVEDVLVDEEQAFQPPGIQGTEFELYIDSARTPRYDEIEYNINAEAQRENPPKLDYHSIGYYVRPGDLYDPYSTTPLIYLDSELGGLVRRSIQRIESIWAAESGLEEYYSNAEQLLAPEIVYIRFLYFNGTEWLTEWDSQIDGGLPKAIEVNISLLPIRDGVSRAEVYQADTVDQAAEDDSLQQFRQIIFLRVGDPASDAAAEEETTTEDL